MTQGWRKRGTHSPFVFDAGLVRETGVTIGGILKDGAVVGEFRFNQPEVEVQFDFPRYVAFHSAGPASGEHALGLLTRIRDHIANDVVPRLERYF